MCGVEGRSICRRRTLAEGRFLDKWRDVDQRKARWTSRKPTERGRRVVVRWMVAVCGEVQRLTLAYFAFGASAMCDVAVDQHGNAWFATPCDTLVGVWWHGNDSTLASSFAF